MQSSTLTVIIDKSNSGEDRLTRLSTVLQDEILPYLAHSDLATVARLNKLMSKLMSCPKIKELMRLRLAQYRQKQREDGWKRHDLNGLSPYELARYLRMPPGQLYESLAGLNSLQQSLILRQRAIDREALFWYIGPQTVFLSLMAAAFSGVSTYIVLKNLVQLADPMFVKFFTAIAAGFGPIFVDMILDESNPSRQLIFPRKNPVPEGLRQTLKLLFQLSIYGSFFYSLFANGLADTMRAAVVGFLALMSAASLFIFAASSGIGAVAALPVSISRENYYDWLTLRAARQAVPPQRRAGCCARLFSTAERTTSAEHPHQP